MKLFAAVMLAATLCGGAARAQDISGTWQGAERIQHVLKIGKSKTGFRGDFYNLSPEASGIARSGNAISSITLAGNSVHFMLDRTDNAFTGTLAADGKSITGVWTIGARPPQPLVLTRVTPKTQWVIDPSPHKTLFVAADKGVTLEVLDWGGSGPPLIFVAGLGNTGHAFDTFAPLFTAHHHVYAITRRGYGLSSMPPSTDENYDADRMGDDVLAVIAALKLDRPILAGHSYGGSELSSVGTRHPEKISALVYLDASYAYAFYETAAESADIDFDTMRRDITEFQFADFQRAGELLDEMQATIPRLQNDYTMFRGNIASVAGGPPPGPPVVMMPQALVDRALLLNEHKYRGINAPVLIIAASPPACKPNCDTVIAKNHARSIALQLDAIAADYPGARIVRIPEATHYVYRSNEADTAQAMNDFMDGLAR